MELTTAALPLWIHMSLLEECRSRVKQALGALGSAATKDLRKTMRLHAALGVSTPEYSEIGDAFTTVLDMARRLDDVEYQLRALRGLYLHHVGYGRFRLAHPIAQEFHALTSRGSDRNDFMFGERMMATSEHYVGKQASARRRLELVLAQDAVSNDERDVFRLRDVVRYGADLHVSTRVFLARVLWLQGFADQAVREVERCLNEAEAIGHAISQCYVLGLAACPISLWVGDQAAATRYITMLVDLSRRHALPFWTSHGARHERALLIKAGGPERASRMRPNGHDDGVDPNSSFRSLTTLMPLGEALGQAGRIAEGLALLEVGIEQFEDNCFTPEIMRLKGELTLLQGMPDATRSAEASFRQAVDGAREHGTLSWELRAATSLARLIRCQGRAAEATACLRPIYDQFTEGFGTADLIVAKQLLDELGA